MAVCWWQLVVAASTAPATQITPAELRRPSDLRTYIRPLGELPVPRRACHANHTGRAAQQPQGIHPTPWRAASYHACHANHTGRTAATQRPQGVHPTHHVPRLPRKSHWQRRGDPATSGRTSDPLESSKHRACHANHTGRAAATQRPQRPAPRTPAGGNWCVAIDDWLMTIGWW